MLPRTNTETSEEYLSPVGATFPQAHYDILWYATIIDLYLYYNWTD